MARIEGKIAAILDHTSVVINLGSKDGVSKNDVFWIYSEIGPFFDPDTEENLGSTKQIWGKVIVSTIEERFCIAKTAYEVSNFLPLLGIANLFGTTTTQIRLPINENQVQKGSLTKIEVGFKVLLEKQQEQITEKKVKALPKSSKSSDDKEKVEP